MKKKETLPTERALRAYKVFCLEVVAAERLTNEDEKMFSTMEDALIDAYVADYSRCGIRRRVLRTLGYLYDLTVEEGPVEAILDRLYDRLDYSPGKKATTRPAAVTPPQLATKFATAQHTSGAWRQPKQRKNHNVYEI